MEVNDVIDFYTEPEKEVNSSFIGWGKILEITEPKQTFLLDRKLYQLFRVLVEFSPEVVPNGCTRGKYNDPWMTKPFTTHRHKRVLIHENPTDSDISDLSYTPTYFNQNKDLQHGQANSNRPERETINKETTAYLLELTAGGAPRTFELPDSDERQTWQERACWSNGYERARVLLGY